MRLLWVEGEALPLVLPRCASTPKRLRGSSVRSLDLSQRVAVRPAEAAQVCGVDLRTVRRWIRDGLPIHKVGGSILIQPEDLRLWLSRHRVDRSQPAPPPAPPKKGPGRPRKRY